MNNEIVFEYNGKGYTLDELHYQGTRDFKLGDDRINTYICKGQRGRGKTTLHLSNSVEWCLTHILENDDDTHKFHFLRRTDEQMKEVLSKGLFSACLSVPKYAEKFHGYVVEKIDRKDIYLQNPKTDKTLHVGYLETLNNVKGKAVEDSDNLIFDEFVEPERRLYKGGDGGINEPELLGRLDDTLFRKRKRWLCLLANEDSPTDPYTEYFNIPFGIKDFHDRERKLYYHFDYCEAYQKYKEGTAVGQLWKGTSYGEYSVGQKALGEINTDMIVNKPAHAILDSNINVAGTELTLWYDQKNGLYYCQDNCKFDKTKPIYTVFSRDMTVNSLFVSYQTNFLMRWKWIYACGLVRFNSQKSANMFGLVLSLTK